VKSNRTAISIAFSLMALLLCSACLLNSATEVGGTPGAPTFPPVFTPTPTSPDPLPDAANALIIADYTTAQTLYTAAIATTNKCAALYGLGVTDLNAGQPVDAEAALTRALTECPSTFNAYVQRGEARHAQGTTRNADASSDYQAALTLHPGLIDSYLYEHLSLTANSPAEQFKYLQLAANAPRYLAGTFALRSKIARTVLDANDPVNAVNQYDLILAQATDTDYRAGVEVEAGNALMQLAKNISAQTPTAAVPPTALPTQYNVAFVRYKLVITNSPDSPAALDALIGLVNAGQPVDIVLRTQINTTHGKYAPVVSYLPPYLSTTPANKIPASLYFWLGQSQRGVGNTAEALNAFQKVRDAYPSDPLASTAALEQGRTQFVAKNYPAAIAAYLACAAAYPNSADAPEALSRAGIIAQTYGDAGQAVTIYDKLGAAYPKSDQAQSGLFSAGMILAPTDPTRAATFFGRAGDAHGLLWQGKMLTKIGNTSAAKQAWIAADANAPGTFFSLRAHDLLNNLAAYRPAGTVRFPVSNDAERTAAEAWLRQVFNLGSVSTALSADLAQDGRLTRGAELWALGWQPEARAEFDAFETAKRDDPAAMYQLAVYENSIGDYSAGLIAATRLINLSKQPAESVPAYIARLAYPVPFRDSLLAATSEFKVDPLYFSALIRLESNFDPLAKSGSDARGLTQIVPATAQDIVGHLGWPPNFAVSDLYRPQISLRMGAFYVDFVRRYIGDYPAAILAGYNAGPGNAKNWVQQAGADVDQLYEIIGASNNTQAQAYIRYTYEFNELYRHLYGG
jgi:soluble lytic murein transglycosylase